MDPVRSFRRTVVIGKGGAGKSWFAARMGQALGIDPVDLDAIHWEPEGFDLARDSALAREMTRGAGAGSDWIIEGVYGWLVQEILPRATALVWLDLPEAECVANLRRRGPRRDGETAFADLIAWAEDYPVRQTSSSRRGHAGIFAAFSGRKQALRCRDEIDRFLSGLPRP